MAWWLPQFLPKPASVDLSGDLVTVNRAARDHAVDLILGRPQGKAQAGAATQELFFVMAVQAQSSGLDLKPAPNVEVEARIAVNQLQLAMTRHEHIRNFEKTHKPVEIVHLPEPPHEPNSIEALRDYCRELEERLRVYETPPQEYVFKTTAIIRVVCSAYNVSRTLMMSQQRRGKIVRPRHIAMYLSVEKTELSLPTIGRIFGNRDHTTILHAHRKIATLRASDPKLDSELSEYEQRIVQVAS